jgi:hypothetical protein
MGICDNTESAFSYAESCFFQVIVEKPLDEEKNHAEGEEDPSYDSSVETVAYDLQSFVDPATDRIDLEPVINRLIGMVLLKRREAAPASLRMHIERMIHPNRLRERVEAAVLAQCEFINEIGEDMRVFDSPAAF